MNRHIQGVWDESLQALEHIGKKLEKFHGIKQENLSAAQVEIIKDLRAQCVAIGYNRYLLLRIKKC